MRDAVHTEERNGYTLSVYIDDDVENPRDDYDHFGHMVCWHRDYCLGDNGNSTYPREFPESDDFRLWLKSNPSIVLPLYLYDHSGITMSLGPFDCPWDSGQVGCIYVTLAEVRKEYSVKRVTKSVREKAIALLKGEVHEYDQYLTNDVYYYVVEDSDGETVDSCCGFFGYDYALEQAREAFE